MLTWFSRATKRSRYRRLSPALTSNFSLFNGAHEDLEGVPTEGTVILEFPNAAAAKAWYDGRAYRKVREHRFKGANYRAILIEGV